MNTDSVSYTGSSLFGYLPTSGESKAAREIDNLFSRIAFDFYSESETIRPRDKELRKDLEEIYWDCSEPNWDGYGASPASFLSYADAKRFIEVMPYFLPDPEISIHPDGMVAFEWDFDEKRNLMIALGGNSDVFFSAMLGASSVRGYTYFGDSFPKLIMNIFEEIGNC